MTTYNLGNPLSFNVTAFQNAIGIDGVTRNAWTVAQAASGIPRLALTIPQAGTGATWYASVYVQKPSGSPAAAYPGLVFSSVNQSGAGPIGFSVVLNELAGTVTSSASSGFGVNNLTAGSYTFYEMWVSLTDAASSSELTVELYPTSYGYLAACPIQFGQVGSAAVFTNIIVSTMHP